MNLTHEELLAKILRDQETAIKELAEALGLVRLMAPHEFTLAQIAAEAGRTPDAIRKHLIANYIEGEDYNSKSKGGKIYVARDAALSIRRHYVA